MKNKKTSTITIIFFLLISLSSCSDIFEKNISNEKIEFVSPINNQRFKSKVNFFWNTIEGATKYHIRIVSPNFDSIVNINIDTSTAINTFTAGLATGKYQCRINASNNSYETQNSRISFEIDNQGPSQPFIITPQYGDSVSSPINLSWQNEGDSKFDSLFIYSDSLLNKLSFAYKIEQQNYYTVSLSKKIYFWYLTSYDDLGNASKKSPIGKFIVK